MPEFLHLLAPDEARAALLAALPDPEPASETIDTLQALGRVNAEDVRAPHPLPSFSRSSVDGYAVHAADTFGASESLPAYLTVVGDVRMGAAPAFGLQRGQAALIHTGGMLPEGADAVIMLEYTQSVEAGCAPLREIEVVRPVAPGENVIRLGEDVAEGQVVLPRGCLIRPAEIGGLMALGLKSLRVAKKPRVGILSSGDEVVPPEVDPLPGQVRDVNSYTLSALVAQHGGEAVRYGILPDRLDAMQSAARRALAECDVVVLTAGSSASARDLTAEVIRSLGEPGVLVHGVNVRPGKPTILGVCDGKAVVGLPGNPVSALVIAGLFIVPVIERLLGLPQRRLRPSVMARLTINIPSQAGREDWVAVRLLPGDDGWLAEPVFAKSNLIFSLAAADGLVRIPPNATGLSAGEMVFVEL
ncbi:MAG: molybdopterin-binding protein [Candidatus Villigracilaceae bacterium]